MGIYQPSSQNTITPLIHLTGLDRANSSSYDQLNQVVGLRQRNGVWSQAFEASLRLSLHHYRGSHEDMVDTMQHLLAEFKSDRSHGFSAKHGNVGLIRRRLISDGTVQWGWRDPLIHRQWVCRWKDLLGEGLAWAHGAAKPVIGLDRVGLALNHSRSLVV